MSEIRHPKMKQLDAEYEAKFRVWYDEQPVSHHARINEIIEGVQDSKGSDAALAMIRRVEEKRVERTQRLLSGGR